MNDGMNSSGAAAMTALETSPTSGQQNRLQAWLREVSRACRRQAIRVVEQDGELHLIDTLSETLIGVGLVAFTDGSGDVRSLECDGSILDGVWLVQGPDGDVVEQRTLKKLA